MEPADILDAAIEYVSHREQHSRALMAVSKPTETGRRPTLSSPRNLQTSLPRLSSLCDIKKCLEARSSRAGLEFPLANITPGLHCKHEGNRRFCAYWPSRHGRQRKTKDAGHYSYTFLWSLDGCGQSVSLDVRKVDRFDSISLLLSATVVDGEQRG